MSRKTFGPLTVDVIAEGRVGRDSLMVCSLRTIPLLRPENRVAPCRDCGDEIQYHPSSPTRPRKVCPSCCSIRTLREDRVELCATTKQVAFVEQATRKRGAS